MFPQRAARALRPESVATADSAKRRLHATIRMLSDALLHLDHNHPSLALDETKRALIALADTETHITQFETQLRTK